MPGHFSGKVYQYMSLLPFLAISFKLRSTARRPVQVGTKSSEQAGKLPNLKIPALKAPSQEYLNELLALLHVVRWSPPESARVR